MWTYEISTGALRRDGELVGHGYSGKKGRWRNNPAACHEKAAGPIPPGRYRIGRPRQSARTGPHVMDLTPIGHDALGRSALQIHGDNRRGDASSGCIVANRPIREHVSTSWDDVLEAIP